MNYDASISTLFFLPGFLFLFKYNRELARLYFYILISGLSLYEFYHKKLYLFNHLDLNEYNYIGDQCRSIGLQYFIVDIFYIKDKAFFFHHGLILFAVFLSFYLNQGYYLIIYFSLNEISSIFLSLKLLNIYKKTCNLLFIFNFFIFRILLLPLLTFYYRHIYHAFIILLLDDILHLYWIIKLSKQFILFK